MFWGGGGRGGVGPASLVSALLSEWRERAPASLPCRPCPSRRLLRPAPEPSPKADLPASCAPLHSPLVRDPARTPDRGASGPGGAQHLGTPSDAQRGSASPADGAAAVAAARRTPLRPRPVRLSAELAPPPRQLRRPLPRPSVLPSASPGSTRLAPPR